MVHRQRFQRAALILETEDRYARLQGTRGPHPGPIGPVRYSLVAEMVGGARQDFAAPLELIVRRNPSGYDLFFDRVRVPELGARQVQLAAGTYLLRVEAPETRFYQRTDDLSVAMPDGEQSFHVDLKPGYAYPFPEERMLPAGQPPKFQRLRPTLVRGGLVSADGRGIAGARVELVPSPWGFSEYLTDASGQWVLVVPDDFEYPIDAEDNVLPATFDVRYTFPEGVVVNLESFDVVKGSQTAVNQAALRGTVLNGAGVPLAGASIAVSGRIERTRSGSDGTWVHYFGVDQPAVTVDVIATAPGGASQTQSTIAVQPRATVWVPAFRFP